MVQLVFDDRREIRPASAASRSGLVVWRAMDRLRFVASLVLALAVCASVSADTKEERAAKLKKKVQRIETRKALRAGFSPAEQGVADRIEQFALEPIRNWQTAFASLPKGNALANPIRYYLLDDDWEVQAFVCQVAARSGLTALIPDLADTYDSGSYPIIRRNAVVAVSRLAVAPISKSVARILTSAQGDDDAGVRFAAVVGLENLKDLKALSASLDDADPDTRYRALAASARLGSAKSQETLLSGFRSYVANRDQRKRPSPATTDIGERYAQYLNCLALGRWGDPRGIKLLRSALLRHEGFEKKSFLGIGAAAALGQSKPVDEKAEKLRARALGVALKSRDAEIRANAAFGAGIARDPNLLPALKALVGDSNANVSYSAVAAVSNFQDEQAVALLVKVIKGSRDDGSRLAAVQGLHRSNSAASIAGLVRALKDKRYVVRMAAARALGRKDGAVAGVWKELARAARDPDFGVREAAVVALARSGAEEGLKSLATALRDRDSSVRIRALRGLGRHVKTLSVRSNKKIAERSVTLLLSGDLSERRAARGSLTRVRSPHSVPPLLVALESKSEDSRRAAFSVLKNYNRGKTLGYGPGQSKADRHAAAKTWLDWWSARKSISPLPPPATKRSNQDLLSFHKYSRDLRWRGIDLVICYDSTGSMNSLIQAVKQRIDVLIQQSVSIVPNMRLSLFTYRDVGDEYVYYGTPLTYAKDNIRGFAQVVVSGGGGNFPEAVGETVRAAIDKLAWRKEAQKVIVVIGDAPYHEKGTERLLQSVKAFARPQNRGSVHAILVDSALLGATTNTRKKRPGVTNHFTFAAFRRLAESGGGKAITIQDSEVLIRELLVLSFGEQWRAELESGLEFD